MRGCSKRSSFFVKIFEKLVAGVEAHADLIDF